MSGGLLTYGQRHQTKRQVKPLPSEVSLSMLPSYIQASVSPSVKWE